MRWYAWVWLSVVACANQGTGCLQAQRPEALQVVCMGQDDESMAPDSGQDWEDETGWNDTADTGWYWGGSDTAW